MYVHTPIITTSDAEGAGEMFQVRMAEWQNGRTLVLTWHEPWDNFEHNCHVSKTALLTWPSLWCGR